MRLLSDQRFWTVTIFVAAAVGFVPIAIRLWRIGDVTNSVGLAGLAVLFLACAALILLSGRGSKKGGEPRSRRALSPRRFGERIELMSSPDALKIELADAKLRAAGISATVVGQHVPGGCLGSEARSRLVVDSADLERAMDVLEDSDIAALEPAAKGE